MTVLLADECLRNRVAIVYAPRARLRKGMWSEGLGKRVMSKREVFYVLKSFVMGKFAGAVMWVLREAFVGANENEKSPQINTDGHRCPQADGRSEREFT